MSNATTTIEIPGSRNRAPPLSLPGDPGPPVECAGIVTRRPTARGGVVDGRAPGDHHRRVFSPYYDDEGVRSEVERGRHRELIGGMWDEIGRLQIDFLRTQGLAPTDRLLDVGCGSLRAGVHFVRYLESGNYFGIDMHGPLLDAGYELEIVPAGLADRLPRSNLQVSRDFEARFAAPIDVALAMSVFTHLPLNHLRLSLERLEDVVRVGGRFFATFFEVPAGHPYGQPYRQDPGDIVTGPVSDPYHYRRSDIVHAADGTRWTASIHGAWGHPRNQQMAVFERR
jgi:SAM-dependent methyltransferase